MPIIVTVTDAEWHDAPGTAASGEDGLNDYGTAENGVPTRATAIARAKPLNAHVIGIAGHGSGATGNAKARMLATAHRHRRGRHARRLRARRHAPGDVRDHAVLHRRLAAPAKPPTGATATARSPSRSTTATATASATPSPRASSRWPTACKFDIHVEAADVDPMTVDNFMLKLVPNLTGVGPAAMCITMTPAPLQDNFTGPKAAAGGDGVLDTFPGIGGGQQICFDVIPKMNTTVMNTDRAADLPRAAPRQGHGRRHDREPRHAARRLLPGAAEDQERPDPVTHPFIAC